MGRFTLKETTMTKFSFFRQLGAPLAGYCALVALAAGCSTNLNKDLADLGAVKGTVTYNGKPVVHGAVKFFKDKTLTCVATIETDGTYNTVLVPSDFTVAIVTMIEPREAVKLAKEGPREMAGTAEGGLPVRQPINGVEVEKPFDPYSRLPTLAAVLQKLSPGEKSTLEAVQKRYAKPEDSGLTVKVKRGSDTHDFNLN
jgi:hypothetical protein